MPSSPFRLFKVTLWVTAVDPKTAIKAARDDAEARGNPRGAIRNTEEAVHWIMDPGSPFDKGLEIEESTCEEVNSL